MPELPEAETITRGLEKRIAGDVIESVRLGEKPLTRGLGKQVRFFFSVLIGTCLLASAPVTAQSQAAPSSWRARRTLPLTKFYDTPHPLPAGKPGQLIRSEPADEYDLSADFRAVRILYYSRSASGEQVAASGVVLVPDTTPPKGGWPVIAWAHDFSGAARQCAPSLLRTLDDGSLLSMYINLGYAVVATDYTGLGTSFRNAVMDVQSNATDVIDAISAAHAAVPKLSTKWIAMGASLGANVAMGVAEMEDGTRDSGYLGSVVVSLVPDLKAAYARPAKEQSPETFALLAYGIKTVYPAFDIHDMLTEKAIPAYEQVDKSCGTVGNGLDLPASEMLKPNWESNKFVEEFFSKNTPGLKPAHGPLLVISDDQDPAAPLSKTVQVIARMCRQGDRIQFDKFSDAQPSLILGDSVRDQMAWIEARFAGRPASSNCP